jgi:hypothetical protein
MLLHASLYAHLLNCSTAHASLVPPFPACSDEPDAETTCEAEVAAALAAFPASLDAQQTLASLRLSQNYREDRNYKLEAGEIMQKVCAEVSARSVGSPPGCLHAVYHERMHEQS